jgi:hypothetical protein
MGIHHNTLEYELPNHPTMVPLPLSQVHTDSRSKPLATPKQHLKRSPHANPYNPKPVLAYHLTNNTLRAILQTTRTLCSNTRTQPLTHYIKQHINPSHSPLSPNYNPNLSCILHVT